MGSGGGLGDTGLGKKFAKITDPLGILPEKTTRKIADPLGFFQPSGPDTAAEAAARAEAERLAAIKAGIEQVNSIYDSPERQAQYNQLLEDQRKLYLDQLTEDRGDAERKSRFALARGGQYGSRVAIDTASDIEKAFQRGTVNAEREAQGAVSSLRSADEESRNQLIAMIQSGLDATTASQRAQSRVSNELEGARANLKSGLASDTFGILGQLWSNSQKRAEERRAQQQLGTLYGTAAQWGYGGGRS